MKLQVQLSLNLNSSKDKNSENNSIRRYAGESKWNTEANLFQIKIQIFE